MKSVILVISTLLSFYSPFSLGQTNKRVNVWYFGRNAGLNFDTGNPAPLIDGALNTWEGCATICNENGSLLFYTDGNSIWNKNHSILPNATSIGGSFSSSQSGIIVPQPENPNRYFVFSSDAEGGSGGIQYAIVDMTLNSGLGGLISKNNRLLTRASEKLTAVRHCNNKDFWVIAHELDNNSFRAYLVTNNGISTTSVESKVGSVQYGDMKAIGYMKASNNGRKIAVCSWWNGNVELFDFNNETGNLSNAVSCQNDIIRHVYGAEFSPNNQYLYVSTAYIIHQFEVNTSNSAQFIASRVEIGTATTTGASRIGALQIASNNLIYVALDNLQFLGVINKPNTKGVECDYIEKGISLAGKKSGLGLPNLITSYFNLAPSVTVTISKGNNCNDVTLLSDVKSNAPNLVFQWFLDNMPISSGGNQASFKPTRSGSYFVSVKEAGQCINDSVKSTLTNIFILEATPKIVSTNCGSVQLQANANASLKWSGNGIPASKATQDTLTVYGSGTQIFKVHVFNPTDTTCYIEKEITVNFTSSPPYRFGKDTISACDSITLSVPVNANWNSYVWSLPNGTTINSNKLLARQSGRYVITVKNTNSNCEVKDEINLNIGTTPVIKSDEKLCLTTNSTTIDAGATGNNLTYEWLPSNTKNSSLAITAAGKYLVKATSPEGCSATRSIEVFLMPIFDLGNELVVCEGSTVELKPNSSNLTAIATYLWTTGETTQSIIPKISGTYKLSIRQATCQTSDSVKIIINALPKVKTDETICLEKTIEAGGLESNLIYEWQGLGETKPVIQVLNEGVYKVRISNQFGCSKTRTITVSGPCDTQIFAPNAFTPNNDSVNDIFKVIIVSGEAVKLDIYNRWGNHIYTEENLNPKWDGTYKGDVCPNGTYSYVLFYKTLKNDSIQRYRGTILIHR